MQGTQGEAKQAPSRVIEYGPQGAFYWFLYEPFPFTREVHELTVSVHEVAIFSRVPETPKNIGQKPLIRGPPSYMCAKLAKWTILLESMGATSPQYNVHSLGHR